MKRELTLIVFTAIMLQGLLSGGLGKLHRKTRVSKYDSPTTSAEVSEVHPKDYLYILRLASQLQPSITRRHRQAKVHEGETNEKDGVKECKTKGHNMRETAYESEHNSYVKRGGTTWTRSEPQVEVVHQHHTPRVWDNWGTWSKCTVTCGIGKLVRWRHCVGGGCSSGEKEAQLRTCTNPAC